MNYALKIMLFLSIILLSMGFVSAILLSDQGTGVVDKVSGLPLDGANLSVQFWDNVSGGNLLYNFTFVGSVRNGSWNLLVGDVPGPDLNLSYGNFYFKDYLLNGEDASFFDNDGNSVGRLRFQSPLGLVNVSFISGLSVIANESDPVWLSDMVNFYNKSEVDAFVANFSNVTGPQGPPGSSVNISSVVDNGDGTFTWFFSDGFNFTTSNLTGPMGPAGLNGNGSNVNMSSIVDNGDGTYTWVFSDGFNFTTGNLTGPQGIQGVAGVNGTNGLDGVNGTNGIDGLNGTDGLSSNISVVDNFDGTFTWLFFYSNGNNYANFTTSNLTGPQGVAGVNGVNGTNGLDGINGTNGVDGTSFSTAGPYLYNNGSNVIFFNASALPAESDPVFSAENSSIWSAISSEGSGRVSNDSFLSSRVDDVNASSLKIVGNQSLNGTFSVLGSRLDINGGWLNPFGTSFINGNMWTDGSIFLTGNVTSVNVGNIFLNGSWHPLLDDVFSVGNGSNRWRDIYGVDVYATSFHGSLNASDVSNPFWISGSGSGNASVNVVPIFSSSKVLADSPLSFNTDDEVFMSIWNKTFYIDGTYGVVSVNAPASESHDASFKVFSKGIVGSGSLNSSSFDSGNNQTLVNIVGASGIDSFTDSSNIIFWNGFVNVSLYNNYMNNATSFFARGNWTGSNAINSINWSYKPAPYIDISGHSNEERGFSISSNGDWEWAMYIPDWSNGSNLCFANSLYPTRDIMCLDNSGNLDILGSVTTSAHSYGGIFFTNFSSMILTTEDVWYTIPNWTSDLSKNVYFDGVDALVVNVSGTYMVSYVINDAINSADTLLYRLTVNNVSEPKSIISQKYTSGASQSAVSYFHRFFNVNDSIRLQVVNNGTNGKVLDIYSKNIIIERID